MKLTVSVLCLLAVFSIAYGFECYQCLGGSVPFSNECLDEYEPTSTDKLNCSAMPDKTSFPGGNGKSGKVSDDGCFKWKTISKEGVGFQIQRGCLSDYYKSFRLGDNIDTITISDEAECDTQTDMDGQEHTLCVCFGDKCNGATGISASIILPILAVMAALIKY